MGNNIAVLTGDYLFAKAFAAIAKNDYGTRISERLATIVCDLSEGEILQNHFGYTIPDSIDIYYERIAKKQLILLLLAVKSVQLLLNYQQKKLMLSVNTVIVSAWHSK